MKHSQTNLESSQQVCSKLTFVKVRTAPVCTMICEYQSAYLSLTTYIQQSLRKTSSYFYHLTTWTYDLKDIIHDIIYFTCKTKCSSEISICLVYIHWWRVCECVLLSSNLTSKQAQVQINIFGLLGFFYYLF